MKSIRSILGRLSRLVASMPPTTPPVVFIFRNHDGSLNPFNTEKLRIARAAGAHVVEFRFLRPPTESEVAS